MKKHSQLIAATALVLMVLLSACGNNVPTADSTSAPSATAAATITNTPDPCAPENIEAEVMKVQKIMREFDDAATLAVNLPQEGLADAIADLQRIRRDAEEQVIPPCLGDLKTYQISHMNTVINTLLAFMRGADQQLVDQGIALARQQHDQYLIELARVLGLTIEPAVIVPTATETPTP